MPKMLTKSSAFCQPPIFVLTPRKPERNSTVWPTNFVKRRDNRRSKKSRGCLKSKSAHLTDSQLDKRKAYQNEKMAGKGVTPASPFLASGLLQNDGQAKAIRYPGSPMAGLEAENVGILSKYTFWLDHSPNRQRIAFLASKLLPCLLFIAHLPQTALSAGYS
ncbi:hypothetical protein ABEX19_15980 [Paenibacillus naphthalenovorans]